MKNLLRVFLTVGIGFGTIHGGRANGVFLNGTGAAGQALGGVEITGAGGPLTALASNPAAFSTWEGIRVQLGATGIAALGEFTDRTGRAHGLEDARGVLPAFALEFSPADSAFHLAAGVVPDAALGGSWRYRDQPGGLGGGTSYGVRENRSSVTLLRAALAGAVDVTRSLTLGVSIGVAYNSNTLETPYTLQTGAFAGLKTGFDLKTDGFGLNAGAGLLYRPHPNVRLGLAYRSETHVQSTGRVRGNADAQLEAVGLTDLETNFRYDAEVENTFPQMISGGGAWTFQPAWTLHLQADWINWSRAFDSLRVSLTNGNNDDLNTLFGSDQLNDEIPLRWRDTWVVRTGLEYAATARLRLRVGYVWGQSPVPDETLLPLTAAIFEHTVTVGAGYDFGAVQVDLAYQYDLPAGQSIEASRILSGEYSSSRVEVSAHRLGLTTTVRF